MITKSIWEDCLADLKWQKNCSNSKLRENEILLFAGLCVLPLLTPILILFDLLLLPFEIGFYFFKKWLRS